MYSHEQLISAVRAAGRDGKTFSVKDVRTQLGFVTRDKKELSRFRRRLRAFEKDAADQLEKVGNNSYRLKPGAFDNGAFGNGAAAETPQELAREPASGVFETVQVPDAPAGTEAPAALADHAPSQLVHEDSGAPAPATTPAIEALPPRAAAEAALQPAAEAPSPAIQAAALAQPTAAEARTPAILAAPSQAKAAEAPSPASVGAALQAPAEQLVAADVVKLPAALEAPAQAVALHLPEQPAANDAAAVASTSSQSAARSVGTVQRAVKLATAIVSSALAASAAVSGRVRERSHSLREQLWSCIQAVPAKQHAIARLRGWAENLRPLGDQVRSQLEALRQRVKRA